MQDYNPLPNIDTINVNNNPGLYSPSSTYAVFFYETKESMIDADVYRSFLKNVEKRVRSSTAYSNYKGYLMGLGMDHCQVHGFINSTMADLEMHHCILTLFDIALMITEYYLNTVGFVSTFDVVQTIKQEHKANNIALVMLTKTPHQLYHNDSSFFIHPDMCFGNWPALIEKYKEGLTQDLAFKLLYYIKKAIQVGYTDDAGLLNVRDTIMDWSNKNA
jgi:hypothetical protein